MKIKAPLLARTLLISGMRKNPESGLSILRSGKGYSPNTLKLPVVKTASFLLGVAAVVIHGKDLYGSYKNRDFDGMVDKNG